jgi:hypothetical protein
MPLDLGSGAFFCLQTARRQNGMSTILVVSPRFADYQFKVHDWGEHATGAFWSHPTETFERMTATLGLRWSSARNERLAG